MSTTEEIKQRLSIVEVAGQHVQLKKTGKNYKGLCPFHTEKTPSFVVFPETGQYRCFGCGEGGDIFSFIMEHEGLSFPEALRQLADQAGVEIEPPSPQKIEQRETVERLQQLLGETATFYQNRLVEGQDADHAREYVAERGLTFKAIDQFQIGYAPDGWDTTSTYLTDLGYSLDDLIEAGLMVVKDNGRSYDRFRNRLVIPIKNARGNVVGFGARALAKDAVPKYLNSPQSTIFDKSRILYGFFESRRSIRESETAVIAEGYMDVIQAHQAGFTHVVAQMGTALTEDQLRQLAPFASRLILALDPDAAGQMATARGREVIERVSKAAAEEVAQEGDWNLDDAERDHRARLTTEFTARGMIRYKSRMGFDIRVAILPEGQDPDDLIRENPDAFADLLDNAVPIVDYVIQSKIAERDLNDPAVKSEIATEITPLIDDIDDAVERSHYRQRLARLLKVHERTFFPGAPVVKQQNQRKGYAENNKPYQQRLAPGTRIQPVSATPTSEIFCLAALLRYPRLLYQINRIFAEELTLSALGITPEPEKPIGEQILWPDSFAGELRPTDFVHPEHRMIFAIWQSSLENGEDPLTYLRDVLDQQLMLRVETWLEQSLDGILREVEPVNTNFSERKSHDEALRRLLGLRLKRLDERMQEVEYLIQDADGGGNAGSVKQYSAVINALFKARVIIENAHNNIGKMNLQDVQEKNAASAQS